MIKVSFKKGFKRGQPLWEPWAGRGPSSKGLVSSGNQAGTGTPKEGPEGCQAQMELADISVSMPIQSFKNEQ